MAYADLYTQYQSVMPQGGGFDPLETEEERRKRLAREAGETESTPVKETRTTDPETGEVKLKIEGSEADLSAANPLTPTVIAPKPAAAPQFNFQPPAQAPAPTQPVAPEMPRPVSQPQMQQPVAQPVTAPTVPTPMAPVVKPEGQAIRDDSGAIVGYETPQQMLGNMMSGAAVGANAPTPVKPVAPVNPVQQMPGAPAANVAPVTQTATTANVVPEGGYASTLGSLQAQPYVEKFVNDQMNPARMAALAYDKTAPIEVQRAAAAQHLKQLQDEKGFKDAETFIAEKAGNGTDFARMLAKNKDEGSYVKAYIFQRLGLTKLAEQEQQKLGAGTTWMPSIDGDGNRALLEFDANGLAKRGFNSEGQELTKKELGQFAASAIGLKGAKSNVGLSPFISNTKKDADGNPLIGRMVTQEVGGRTITMIESGGRLYPPSGWTPQTETTQTNVYMNKKLADFNMNPSIAAATKLMEIAAEQDLGDGKLLDSTKKQIQDKLPNFAPPTEGIKKMSAPAAGASLTNAAYTPNEEAGGFIKTAGPAGRDFGRESPAMYRERLKRETAAAEAEIQKNKELEVAEKKIPAEQKGKNAAKDINDQRQADETYKILRPISDAVKQSTGSGIGAGVDTLAGVFGKGTTGAENIAKLEVLSYKLLQQVPRMEGSQSNIDVEMYKKAAGDLGNDKKPVSVRLAALETIIEMLKIADKKGANDWTFGQEKAPTEFRVIKREKIQ